MVRLGLLFLFVLGVNFNVLAVSDSAVARVRSLSDHEDIVLAVAYSPNGKWIASGSWDGGINLYRNDSDLIHVQTLYGHETAVTGLQFSRDSKHLISGGNDFKVITWKYGGDWTGWEEDTVLKPHSQPVSGVAYGPGMKMIFSASADGKIMIRNLPNNKEKIVDHKQPINCMAISSNRQFIYIADHTPVIKEYDMLGNQRRTFEGHSGEVLCVAYSPNRKYLVTGSADKSAIIWDLTRGKVEHTLKGHSWKVNCVAISGDSKYVVTGGKEGSCKLWDIQSGELLDSFVSVGKDITSLSFSPDNQYVAIGMWQEANKGEYGAVIWKTGLPSRFKKKAPPRKSAPGTRSTPKRGPSNTGSSGNSQKVIQKSDQIEIRTD